MSLLELTRAMLFERGAVEFGAFRLKLHDKNPNAPLSPFFFNLRTPDNPKPGPLAPSDCELVACCIWTSVLFSGISFSAVCGIPNAGTPIVEALERIVPRPRGFRIIPLAKEVTETGRKIIPAPGFQYKKGERVLLFDDLITKADTKMESIESIEQEGGIVAALAVLIDREQGGVNDLIDKGYNVITVFPASSLFQGYKEEKRITQQKLDECLEYMWNN